MNFHPTRHGRIDLAGIDQSAAIQEHAGNGALIGERAAALVQSYPADCAPDDQAEIDGRAAAQIQPNTTAAASTAKKGAGIG